VRRTLLVVAIAGMLACSRESEVRTFPNAPVILISIDTLRADHLPAYGYAGVATPHIDALRSDAILFRNAYAHVPLTLPSHVSMLTGLLPPQHGVRNNLGYVLRAEVPTLPAWIKQRGYATGAAVSAYVLRGSTGIARGFDFYDDAIVYHPSAAIGTLDRPGGVTAAIAAGWIERQRGQPFFFMLHLFEPHAPYAPSYDGEIAAADAIVGSFVQRLKRSGIYDRAIVILTSDHGEGLGDHGEPEHGIFVYREAIHVPLMLKLPRSARRGEVSDAPAGLVDIVPTIAELTGTAPPSGLSGRSLLQPQRHRHIYSESFYPRIHLGWSELRSLVGARFHFIEAPRPEMYDVVRDPAERTNVASNERRAVAALRGELASGASAFQAPGPIDSEDARKLAALGYLSATATPAGGPLPDPKDRIGEIAAMIEASELLRKGRYDAAIASLRAIVTQNPRLTDAWNALGSALEAAGRLEEAADAYKTVIAHTPELAGEFGVRRAAVLLELERLDEAERHARLAERTNRAEAEVMLARIAMARGDFAGAERHARAAAEDRNQHLRAETLLAQIYAQQSKLTEALALVDRIDGELRVAGGGPVESLEFARGDILARMERYDEAIAALRREIAGFPRNRQPYANLFLVYAVTGRPAEARQALEDMARAIPSRSTYLFAARTAAALGDERGAVAWRRRAAMIP
jgi:tetratricopeptide (TPR) repeat protein